MHTHTTKILWADIEIDDTVETNSESLAADVHAKHINHNIHTLDADKNFVKLPADATLIILIIIFTHWRRR